MCMMALICEARRLTGCRQVVRLLLIYHLLCRLAEPLQTIRNLSRDQRAELNNLIRLKACHVTRYDPSPPPCLGQPHV